MDRRTGHYFIFGVCLLLVALTQPMGAALIEGFESGDLALYTAVLPSDFTVNATAAHDGSYGLLGIESCEWIYRADGAVTVQQGDRLSAWLLRTNVDVDVNPADPKGGRSYLGFGASAAGTYSAVMASNTGQLIIQKNEGYYNFVDLKVVSQTYLANHWYKMVIDWSVGGLITVHLYDSDGLTLLNSLSTLDTTYTSGGIAFRSVNAASGDNYFDTYERTAIPLPGTLLLFGSGLLGLMAWRRWS